jgi:hypothetical protein
MARTFALSLLILAAGLLTGAAGAVAAELLMFDDPNCAWCRRWDAEVGPSYPHSPEGQLAPLRRLHIRDQASAGVSLASRINATPTFVLVHDGREIGRIVGHPGIDFFYPRLAELLDRLPPLTPHRAPRERSAAAR